MQDFRKLIAWQKGHQLALDVYRATADFPREEQYGLTSQLRRCAVSVPSNIAEGCGRGGYGDFARFLQIALGSVSELDYQLLLARDLELLSREQYVRLRGELAEERRMLVSLLEKVTAARTGDRAPNNHGEHSLHDPQLGTWNLELGTPHV